MCWNVDIYVNELRNSSKYILSIVYYKKLTFWTIDSKTPVSGENRSSLTRLLNVAEEVIPEHKMEEQYYLDQDGVAYAIVEQQQVIWG